MKRRLKILVLLSSKQSYCYTYTCISKDVLDSRGATKYRILYTNIFKLFRFQTLSIKEDILNEGIEISMYTQLTIVMFRIQQPTLSLPDLNAEYLEMGFRGGGALGTTSRTKRMRTSFKHHQLRTMKSYFAINHNPDAKDLKQLSQKTGLPKRVLQVKQLFSLYRALQYRHLFTVWLTPWFELWTYTQYMISTPLKSRSKYQFTWKRVVKKTINKWFGTSALFVYVYMKIPL